MKNLVSSFLFLLISNFVFGQIEWVGNQAFSETATDLVRTSQGQYILVHNGLTVFDSVGNVVFSALNNDYPDWDGVVGFSDIVELPDSSIVLAATWGECDVIVDIIVKFDKNWNEVWQQYGWFVPSVAALSDNSTIFAGWFLSRWLADGIKAWENDLLQFWVNDIVALPNDTIVLATTLGIFTMNKDGDLLDSLPNIILEKIMRLPDGNLLGLANDVLYHYSPNFVQLGFFQQQGQTFVDIEIGQNEIAVLTSAPSILRLDLGLQQLGSIPLVGHNQTFSALAFSDDGYMLAGSERYGSDEHGNYSAFIKQVAANGSTAEDAALTTVSQDGPLEVSEYWNLFTITIPNIGLTVENNGATTIERLNANFSWPDASGFPCPFSNTFSKPFENLNLQPGASTTLDWGELKIRTWEDFSGEQIELCFWTSLPDHHLETNNDNDVSCTEVLVAEHEPFPLRFQTTFLPSSDEVYFDLPPSIDPERTTIAVFNMAAQLVASQKLQEYEPLSLRQLPDGMYLLRASFEGRVGWAKVVKY